MLYFTAFANSLNPWFPIGAQIHTESLGESYLKFLSIHITHLSCASVWSAERWWPGRQVSGSGRATPGPQPFCRTGSSKVEITLRQAFPFTIAAITLSLWDVANHFERPAPLSPSCRLGLPLKRFVTHAFITGHLKESQLWKCMRNILKWVQRGKSAGSLSGICGRVIPHCATS